MLTISTVEKLREQISQWKRQGLSIGFVPTMGNLHAGHLALVDHARQQVDKVVASIFVNPTQFGPNEDFDAYPRTMDADLSALNERAADLVFTPGVDEMLGDVSSSTVVAVPGLGNILCGASRPGHFDGVTTIVSKLFNLVQPDVAIFGQKDFQQLQVIKAMVRDLAMPIRIIGHETQREPDGLAMSSRNNYLSDRERALAPQIYAGLCDLADDAGRGEKSFQTCRDAMFFALESAGFGVEYVDIRRQSDLKIPEQGDKSLVCLVAVRLGKTRLIDNVLFELK